MNIRQKILGSFMLVIVLLMVSIGSMFLFHLSAIEDYKKISDTLILENTLTNNVSAVMEAYNALAVASGVQDRVDVYNQKRDLILDTFIQLDVVITDSDSKVAYQGLKSVILGILSDLDKGKEALERGDIVASSDHALTAVKKNPYVESNVTLLVLNELHHLDKVQQNIEKSYFAALGAVGLWTLFVILLVFMYSFIFSEKLTAPITALFIVTEKVAKGEYHLKIPETLLEKKDEVGSLARSFDIMLVNLNQKIDQAESSSALVMEAKMHLEERNADLERAQIATANLMEDLEEEKDAVEQKVIERTEDIEREKNKLLQVTSNMKGGGILLDKNHKVVFTNEFARTALGIHKAQASSDEILTALYTYFSAGTVKRYLERCINGETFTISEIEGGGKIYEIYFHFLKNEHHAVQETIGYFILFIDVTDAKLLERSKSELVAVASHQLRTPLTAMRGNVEMLVDESYGPLNKEQHELLDDVEVSTIRLITMVNEMLDITKIEKGDLEMTIESLNVKEILDSVTADLDTYSKRHEFVISLKNVSSDIYMQGDRVRVRQVFQNLIDNAIKYSAHPGVLEISATVSEKCVEITFKDNGIGVPKNEQSKLFGRFYRASNTAKTASSGSGLGLYIVKSIAKQLGGDIRFESIEGKGTTFFVTLPADDTNKKI